MTSNRIVLLGDLNATHQSWFCDSNNSRGIKLESFLSNNKMMVANENTATYMKGENVIDLVCCSDSIISRLLNITVDKSFDQSDHWPVRFDLSFDPEKKLCT